MCTTNGSSPYITVVSQRILAVERITSRGSSSLLSHTSGVEINQGPQCRGRCSLMMSTFKLRGYLLVHDEDPSDLFLECNHLGILSCQWCMAEGLSIPKNLAGTW